MTAMFTRTGSVIRVAPLVMPFLAAIAVMCFLEVSMATAQPGAASKKNPFPTVYALVLVARDQPRVLQEPPARMNREEFADYLDLQMALLKSRLVLNGALTAAEVTKLEIVKQQKDPTAWLAGRLHVDADKRTGILRVAVSGGEPEEQALLANAVAAAFVHEIGQKESKHKQNRLDQLKEFYAVYDAALRDKRAILKRMHLALGVEGGKLPEPKRQFARKQLDAVENELLEVQSQIRKAKIEIALAKARAQNKSPADVPLSPAAMEQAAKADPAAAQLVEEIRRWELALDAFTQRSPFPDKESGYQKGVERLESAKKELLEKLRPGPAAILKAANQRISELSKVEDLLRAEWDDHVRLNEAANKEVVDLDWLQEEVRQLEVVAKDVGRQMQMLQVELQAALRVTILERAKAPGK